MNIIKVTRLDGPNAETLTPVWINLDHVITLLERNNRTQITMTTGHFFVTETVNVILAQVPA